MDRRDFLLGFTATGAVTTTKVATAKEIDALAADGIRVVGLMADLRLRRGRASEVVWLRGYWFPLDGGEGFFQWNSSGTAPDNGGTVVAPDADRPGRWVRSTAGEAISVKWFGAKGDAQSDDTDALAAAVTASRTSGNVLRIPAGASLRFTRDLEVHSNLRIIGTHGRNFSSILRPDGARILFDGLSSAGAATGGWVFNAIIKDVMIWPLHRQPLECTLLFRNGYSNALENVRFHDCPDHVVVHIMKAQNDLKISNVIIYGNREYGGNCDLIVTEDGTSTKVILADLEAGRYAIHHKGGGLDIVSPYTERCYNAIRFDNGLSTSPSSYINVFGGQIQTDKSGTGWSIHNCKNVNVFGTQVHQTGQIAHHVYATVSLSNVNFWGSDPSFFTGNLSRVSINGYSASSQRSIVLQTTKTAVTGGTIVPLFRLTSSSSLSVARCKVSAWGQGSNGAGSFHTEKRFLLSGAGETVLDLGGATATDNTVFFAALTSANSETGISLVHDASCVEIRVCVASASSRAFTLFSELEVEVANNTNDVKVDPV